MEDSMEGEESPLEVLSRAATMVSPPTYDESRSYSSKEMPCAKWRRQRRQAISNKALEAPLDFSTRHAAANLKPPPSYDQSIQNKMSRPSVIQSTAKKTSINDSDSDSELKSTSSEDACDPAIDEHFRRSLGKDYSSIFSKDNKKLCKSECLESDSTGLTVDDHFAKALGDTWIKLKEKENEEKNNLETRSSHNNNNNSSSQSVQPVKKELSIRQINLNTRKKKNKTAKEIVLNEKRGVSITSGWVKT